MDSKLNGHEWFHSHNEILESVYTDILVTFIDKIRLDFSFTFLFFFVCWNQKKETFQFCRKEKNVRVKSSVWLSLLSESNQYLENSNGDCNASVL